MRWFLISLIIFAGCTTGGVECKTDADCVPAQCCHPTACVSQDQAPNCDEVFCSQVCEPGTLDCGQGSCLCQQGKCNAVISG